MQKRTNISKLLRISAVKDRVGFSRSSIYKKISEGVFPKPISLGSRAVAWIEDEITNWISERIQQSRQQKGAK